MSEDEKRFKVVDRRTFTPEGDARPSGDEPDAAPQDASPPESGGPEAAGAPDPEGSTPTVEERLREKEMRRRTREAARTGVPPTAPGPMPRIDFNTFIFSLASSALIHLGVAPHPETGQTSRDLALAKETIDILSLLEERTRGNLSPEEKNFLDGLLFDLRIRYVEATREPQPPPAG